MTSTKNTFILYNNTFKKNTIKGYYEFDIKINVNSNPNFVIFHSLNPSHYILLKESLENYFLMNNIEIPITMTFRKHSKTKIFKVF